jgi:hypothetical protein
MNALAKNHVFGNEAMVAGKGCQTLALCTEVLWNINLVFTHQFSTIFHKWAVRVQRSLILNAWHFKARFCQGIITL